MSRPALEVADIFRGHGAAWRRANVGRVSLGQMKVMSAIERCRTAALGGHVARCEGCAHTVIAYRPTHPRLRRPTKRACCRVRAPAAADACSSLRPSLAAASPSIVPRRRQERSGSTPHDAVTAHPPPKRHQPFAPDLGRHRPRLRRPVKLARIATAILVNKRPVRSFSPARTPTPRAKAIGSTASRHSL